VLLGIWLQKVKNAGRLPALRNKLAANSNSAFALISSRHATSHTFLTAPLSLA
jgi:hypothetical protein